MRDWWGSMAKIKGAEPIKFDAAAAEELQAKFKATAKLLRQQVKHRSGLAKTASEVWRGRYARSFDEQMKICSDDAEDLADAMDKAADQVKKLAEEAEAEQERRTKAREWEKKHDAWERRQQDKQWYDPRDWGSDHEPEPPDLKPKEPSPLPIAAPAPRSRT